MIRKMRENDLQDVIRIDNQGIHSGSATFRRIGYTEEQWDEKYKKEGRFVFENNGEVIGWIALIGSTKSPAYMGVCEISIYIDNNYQGKGIGEVLIKKEIEFCEKNNIWMLESYIFESNVGSIRLHEKCGFRKVGIREAIGKNKENKWENIVIMEKRSESIY